MTKPLPKWVMRHYATLWNKFKNKEFNYEQACKTIKEKDKRILSVILSELKRNDWLKIKLDPKDSRKRIYQLENPEKVVEKMSK